MKILGSFVFVITVFWSSGVYSSGDHRHDNMMGEHPDGSHAMMRMGTMQIAPKYGQMEAHMNEMSEIAEKIAISDNAAERKKLLQEYESKMKQSMKLMHSLMEHDNRMHLGSNE